MSMSETDPECDCIGGFDRIGSIYYYKPLGNYRRTLLSVGKVHGDEPLSKYGILEARKDIGASGKVGYIAVPEVNPTGHREYEGVDINRDLGTFRSAKTRDLAGLIGIYKPAIITDHHENFLPAANGDDVCGFQVLISTQEFSKSRDGIEFRLAKRLVEHICSYRKMFRPMSGWQLILKSDIPGYPYTTQGIKLEDGVYWTAGNRTLACYYGNVIGIEIPTRNVDRGIAIDAHRECDLFIKNEMESMF